MNHNTDGEKKEPECSGTVSISGRHRTGNVEHKPYQIVADEILQTGNTPGVSVEPITIGGEEYQATKHGGVASSTDTFEVTGILYARFASELEVTEFPEGCEGKKDPRDDPPDQWDPKNPPGSNGFLGLPLWVWGVLGLLLLILLIAGKRN